MSKAIVDLWVRLFDSIEADKVGELKEGAAIASRMRESAATLRRLIPVIESACDDAKIISHSLALRFETIIKELVNMAATKQNDLMKMQDWYERRTLKLNALSDAMPEALRSVRATENAHRRIKKNPEAAAKGSAMDAVKVEFNRWQDGDARYTNYSAFAKKMIMKYSVLTNEGSIKNACTKWRKERKSSS